MMSRYMGRCANSALMLRWSAGVQGFGAQVGAGGLGLANRGLARLFSVIGPNENRTYNLETKLQPFNFNTLWNIKGARTKKKILGRGPGSKHGKQAGRGKKGQGQRGNKKHPKFEGANVPLYIRLPKYGLKKKQDRHDIVTLGRVIYGIRKGWLDPAQPVTIKALVEAGLVQRPRFGLKLLSRGGEDLEWALNFELSNVSAKASELVKSKGGSVTIKYRTPLKLREHLYPEKYQLPLREPIPPFKEVRKLERFKEKGVEVIYNAPKWVQTKLAEEAAIAAENKKVAEVDKFEFPVNRYQGMGQDRIRKRKVPLTRQFKFKLD